LGLVVAVVAGIIIFALGLLLVLAPVLLVASALYFFLGGKRRISVATEKSATGDVIDGEFRVVENPAGETHHSHVQIGSNSE
jgi:hypothetical protein